MQSVEYTPSNKQKMSEKLYVSTFGLDSESKLARLNRMIAEAEGNVEKFRDLYRERFGSGLKLYSEVEAKSMHGLKPIN